MKDIKTKWCRRLAHFAIGAAVASFSVAGVSEAGAATSINPVPAAIVSLVGNAGNVVTCSSVVVPGAPFTPSAFSFDISWVDKDARTYTLSDRSHGGFDSSGNPNGEAGGDVLMLDLNNLTPSGVVFLTPPSTDPMAGIACDQNTAFGGTSSVGRNEITGPNGIFTVNHVEEWVGDGPSQFQPGQGHGTVTMSGTGTCGVDGVTCSYSGVTSDYNADQCDSSVRVFDLASRQQTDHINVGGCFRTDEGAFDPVDQIALFANPTEQPNIKNGKALNQSPFITLISTAPVPPGEHHKILKQINFDGTHGTVNANGGIEQAAYNRQTGLFYVSIPGNSSAPENGFVAVVDPRDVNDIEVVVNFNLKGCNPNGAVFGPDQELLVGCSSGPEQVIDINSGQVLKKIAGTTGGCDEVAYNAGDNTFLGACTDSNNPSTDNLDVSNGSPPIKLQQAINTHTAGAHSVAADPVTITDYVPAAAAAAAGPNVGALCGSSPCILVFGH